MKNKRSYRRAVAAIALATLAVLMLSAAAVLPASANSGPRYWHGTSATGAVVGGGDCPLAVEHETLIFDVPELPSSYYNTVESFLEYGAKVTAEYTFYNPTDMTVTAELLFPFGSLPDYGGYFYDDESHSYQSGFDAHKYGAQVNGETVQTTVRYSYGDGNYDFDPVDGMAHVQDSYVKGEFLHADMPVRIYVYSVSGVDSATYRAARAAASFDCDPALTRVMLRDSLGGKATDDGVTLAAHVNNATEIVLYVFGEDLDGVDWKIYENGGLDTEIDGTMTLKSKQSTTFRALAMQSYDPASGIPEQDWFNAVLFCLEDNQWDDRCAFYDALDGGWDVTPHLMSWYQYELTLAPGQRLTNTITAPLYPTIDDGYDPTVFVYLYLLSPASLWADFGTLDIYVNTPYYLVDVESSMDAELFEKTDTGYELHLEGLPDRDLQFSLCSEQKTEKASNALATAIYVILAIFLAVIAVLILLATAILSGAVVILMMLSAGGAVLVFFWLPLIVICCLIVVVIAVIIGVTVY